MAVTKFSLDKVSANPKNNGHELQIDSLPR
jgi:hypothetical protein